MVGDEVLGWFWFCKGGFVVGWGWGGEVNFLLFVGISF